MSRGARSWTALVEVKTGSSALQTEQLENYLDSAREQGYDAVITISNEIPAVAGQHPTKVDKRKLRKVAVRDAVAAGTLRPTDKGLPDVVARFDALLRFASLRLGRQLGTEVVPVLSRKEQADPTLRTQALATMLCQTGQLSGAIRIPDTVGQLVVAVDLRSSKVTCRVDVDAPREGRPTTRVNWLVCQLKAAPDSVRVETFNSHARGSSAADYSARSGRTPRCWWWTPRRRSGRSDWR